MWITEHEWKKCDIVIDLSDITKNIQCAYRINSMAFEQCLFVKSLATLGRYFVVETIKFNDVMCLYNVSINSRKGLSL